MNHKIIFLILLCLLFQVSPLNLVRHDGNLDTCFFAPLGHIVQDKNFNYVITQQWDSAQSAQLKSGKLNPSDFIHVGGWTPYKRPIPFFTQVGKKGNKIITHKLKPIQDVKQSSDAPQFGLSDSDLTFAFGSPSQAKLFQVPSGKSLIALRFQPAVTGSPYIGKWSILVDLVDEQDLSNEIRIQSQKIQRKIVREKLTPKNVASVLNIVPPFIESSIFWTFSSSPATGTTAPIDYQAFLVVIRGGQKFLAGAIQDGQPGVIQVKDVVKTRTQCTP